MIDPLHCRSKYHSMSDNDLKKNSLSICLTRLSICENLRDLREIELNQRETRRLIKYPCSPLALFFFGISRSWTEIRPVFQPAIFWRLLFSFRPEYRSWGSFL